MVEAHCRHFYIRANRCSSFYDSMFALTGWKTVEINGIEFQFNSILVEKWKGKPYRLVIQRQRRIEGDLDIWEGEDAFLATTKIVEFHDVSCTCLLYTSFADICIYYGIPQEEVQMLVARLDDGSRIFVAGTKLTVGVGPVSYTHLMRFLLFQMRGGQGYSKPSLPHSPVVPLPPWSVLSPPGLSLIHI